MPDLPKPGSEWIRRSDCDVVDVIGASNGYVSYMARGTEEIDPIADFHRDFIENGPVTKGRLLALGWQDSGGAEWRRDDGLMLEWDAGGMKVGIPRDEQSDMVCSLPGCTSMLGVLWAMRLFVTP